LLCFFAVLVPGPVRWLSGYLAKPEVHNASYRQPKHTHNRTAEKQAAYNLHYVNIAPAHLFLACVFVSGNGGAALAGFVFTA
jgi:hypothetical protein